LWDEAKTSVLHTIHGKRERERERAITKHQYGPKHQLLWRDPILTSQTGKSSRKKKAKAKKHNKKERRSQTYIMSDLVWPLIIKSAIA
jgi:hypothetical protein